MAINRHAPKISLLGLLDPLHGPAGPYPLHRDTSHLLLLEFFRRGYRVFLSDPSQIFWDASRNQVAVQANQVEVLEREPYFSMITDCISPHPPLKLRGGKRGRYEELTKEVISLNSFDLILMRKDPPVDAGYLYALKLLRLSSAPVVNAPEALQTLNEKLSILHFPSRIPPTLVASHFDPIDLFIRKHGGNAVAKKLDSFGGRGVEKIERRKPNHRALLRRMTQGWKEPVMVQAFLPEIIEGEKRAFLLNGRPMAALLKKPAAGDFRADPDLGGRIEPTFLTPQEKGLCLRVGAFLKKRGVSFAGIDLIGGKLTDINITSPGLLWELNEAHGVGYERRYEKKIVDFFVSFIKK